MAQRPRRGPGLLSCYCLTILPQPCLLNAVLSELFLYCEVLRCIN